MLKPIRKLTSSPRKPLPVATPKRTDWNVDPDETQTVHWYLDKCRELEGMRGPKAFRRFVRDWFEHFSEKDSKGGLSLWWMKAQTAYWLQRKQAERDGSTLTETFWKNYDAAMCARINQFDDVLKNIAIFNEEEERNMATTETVAPVKKPLPAKKPLPVPAKPAAKAPAKAVPAKKDVAAKKTAPAAKAPLKKKPASKEDGCPFREGTARAKVYALCKRVSSLESALKKVSELEDKNANAGTVKFVREVCKGHFNW